MGLFDRFKKDNSMARIIDLTLRRFNSETVRKIFPGGRSSATKIAHSLATILGLDFDTCDETAIGTLLGFHTIPLCEGRRGTRLYRRRVQGSAARRLGKAVPVQGRQEEGIHDTFGRRSAGLGARVEIRQEHQIWQAEPDL